MSKKPPSEKPKKIEILTGRLNRRTVAASWRQGDSHFELDERDNPRPSLAKSLDALKAVAAEVLHVNTEWTAQNFRVIGIVFGDQGGAATFALVCRKSFEDASKEFSFTTPPRLLGHPTEPGSYTPPVGNASVDAVEEAREQFKAYVKGDRAQGVMALGDDEDDDLSDSDDQTEPKQGVLIEMPAKGQGKAKGRRAARTTDKAAAGAK